MNKTLLLTSAAMLALITPVSALAQAIQPARQPATPSALSSYTVPRAGDAQYQPGNDPNEQTPVTRQSTVTSPTGYGSTYTTSRYSNSGLAGIAPAAGPAMAAGQSSPYGQSQSLDQQLQNRGTSPYSPTTSTAPSYAPATPVPPAAPYGNAPTQTTQPFTSAAPAAGNFAANEPFQAQAGSDDSLFVSGGISKGDRDRMAATAGNYNVKVQMATASGEFVSDVDIAVTDSKGASVFTTQSQGPLLMAKLKPGTYTLTANKFGTPKTEKFTVGKSGTKNINIFWNNS